MMDSQTTTARRPGPFETGPVSSQPEPLGGRDPRLDNQPPLEARVMLDFQEDLAREGVKSRIAELLESAARAPKCDSDAIAGAIGDFCRQAAEVGKRIDSAREKHNRPILNAQRALKGKADELMAPLQREVGRLRQDLNSFMSEKARLAREEQARREKEAAEARAAAAEISPELAEQIAPPPPEKPIARGELGAKVGTRKVKMHKILSVRQLPDRILKNERVVEALDKVIAAEIRNGAAEIKGVEIWEEDQAVVR
jgi:hypothetical protein